MNTVICFADAKKRQIEAKAELVAHTRANEVVDVVMPELADHAPVYSTDSLELVLQLVDDLVSFSVCADENKLIDMAKSSAEDLVYAAKRERFNFSRHGSVFRISFVWGCVYDLYVSEHVPEVHLSRMETAMRGEVSLNQATFDIAHTKFKISMCKALDAGSQPPQLLLGGA